MKVLVVMCSLFTGECQTIPVPGQIEGSFRFCMFAASAVAMQEASKHPGFKLKKVICRREFKHVGRPH